jgi:UDP-3-O-[3-hydroxymyristoyl] glucosamine N-acyltransferase
MQLALTAADIAAITEPKSSRGTTSEKIRGIAGLAEAEPGDLSFLGNTKYKHDVAGTRASVVLLPMDFDAAEPRPNQLFLHLQSPSMALARICARIEQSLWPKPAPGIHPSAIIAAGARIAASATIGPLCVIEDGAVIGERTYLQAQVFIGRNATVGDDCWLMPGVIIETECQIGKRVRLQPGVVIGADGFGYELAKGRWEKLPQVGSVVIGDDVEIGANSTLDRARFSRTTVGEGTKIDNLVQIGHNVIIGRHCMICAQTGISGSSKLEDYVVLGGQVGVAGHITIGKGVQAGGQAGINGDVEPGLKINGTPAIPYSLERRIAVLQRRIPELFKRVDSLEEQIVDAKKSSS